MIVTVNISPTPEQMAIEIIEQSSMRVAMLLRQLSMRTHCDKHDTAMHFRYIATDLVAAYPDIADDVVRRLRELAELIEDEARK